MGQSVTLKYLPTGQDYARVMRIFVLQRVTMRISLALLAIAYGLIIFAVASKGSRLSIFEVVWLLLPPMFVVYVLVFQPARIARRAAANEQLVAEGTWEVSDAGIKISTLYNSIQLDWDSVGKLVATREYYLLLSKNNRYAFRFLPRRAFTSPEQQLLFDQQIKDHLPRR